MYLENDFPLRTVDLVAEYDAAQERIRELEAALRMALGAYDALRAIGADKCLPGFKSCEEAARAARAALAKASADV